MDWKIAESRILKEYPNIILPIGRLSLEDEYCLLKYAKGICVDIGTFCGCSAVVFSLKADIVYTIDPYLGDKNYPQYNPESVQKELNKYNNIKVINDYSYNVVKEFDNSIDVLFIDGLHAYTAIKQDFEDWFPKVKQNGIIILHDYLDNIYSYKCKQFADEQVQNNKEVKYIELMGCSMVFKKL